MIVGDVSKKSYFASTTSAVSEQPIAKYINSQGTRD
jgi:REP element-mobilizing transposase RayT